MVENGVVNYMSEWISVKDHLPAEDAGWCIVIAKNWADETYAFMAKYNKIRGWIYFEDSQEYQDLTEVIFWMPLPTKNELINM